MEWREEQWEEIRNGKMRSESIYKAEKRRDKMVNEIKKACSRMSWRNERWESRTKESDPSHFFSRPPLLQRGGSGFLLFRDAEGMVQGTCVGWVGAGHPRSSSEVGAMAKGRSTVQGEPETQSVSRFQGISAVATGGERQRSSSSFCQSPSRSRCRRSQYGGRAFVKSHRSVGRKQSTFDPVEGSPPCCTCQVQGPPSERENRGVQEFHREGKEAYCSDRKP